MSTSSIQSLSGEKEKLRREQSHAKKTCEDQDTGFSMYSICIMRTIKNAIHTMQLIDNAYI